MYEYGWKVTWGAPARARVADVVSSYFPATQSITFNIQRVIMGLLSKPLRSYTGPYKGEYRCPSRTTVAERDTLTSPRCAVSTIDLELPVEHKTFGTATLKATGRKALELDTTLFTLFYPSAATGTSSWWPSSRPKHMPWLQRPIIQTAQGYAHFTGKAPWMIKLAAYALAARTYLPATIDEPLAVKGGSGTVGSTSGSAATAADDGTATLVDSDSTATDGGRFPLIVFSHGLGGNRTTYSQYCGTLASLGYIVASVEHRDGTAPISVVRLSHSSHSEEREVLYIKPEDITFDKPNRKLSQLEHRGEQLEMRLAEVRCVLDVMKRINDGDGEKVMAENRRSRRGEGTATQLAHWAGRLDLEKPIMTGHSFGGATTLQVLRAGAKQFPFQRGIALDPWVDPIQPFEDDKTSSTAKPSVESERKHREGLDIDVPLLVINSEAFTVWTPHFKLVSDIVRGVKDGNAWLLTLGELSFGRLLRICY